MSTPLGEHPAAETHARGPGVSGARGGGGTIEASRRGGENGALRDIVRRLPPLEFAIVAIALGLLVALSVYGGRGVSAPTLDSFSSFDASSGGYRAFYELLAREGVHVDRFEQHPAFLDGGIGTLLWAQPLPFDTRAQAPAGADVAALAAWVRSGGRLLYLEDGGADGASTTALDATRLALHALALPSTTPARLNAGGRFIAAPLAAAGVARITAPLGRRWRVPRRGARVLFDDGHGALVVTYRLGRGWVTAGLDEEAFTSGRIARGDNARLALALALPRRPRAYVSFDEVPHGFIAPQHWWDIVPRSFVAALLLAAFAFVIALAGAGVRLGPPLVPEASGDETSGDFIGALAALLGRGRAFAHSLAGARESSSRALARALGVPDDTPPEVVLARLEPGDARTAYHMLLETCAGSSCDEGQFVKGVALAGRLRKEYAAHGSPRH